MFGGFSMSYKVLLVDDELVDLEWLKRRVPWLDLNLEVIATANSGFTALRILKEQHVDILISDIKMPIMSGLELAQKAKEIIPNLKIAFISGHEDFYYAKQAIALSAIGYVLKPVKDQELMELLASIIANLDKEKNTNIDNVKFKDTINLYKNEMLHQWLSGSNTNVDYEFLEYYKIITKGLKAAVAVIEVDDVNWKLSEHSEKDRAEILSKCTDMIADYINYEHLGYYYFNDERLITIILKELEPSVLNYLLMRLIEKVKKNATLTITIGLGGGFEIAEKLPESYKKAKEALEYKMFIGKSKVICYENIPKGKLQDPVNLEHKLKSIFSAITEYNLTELNNLIEDLFISVKGLNTKTAVYNFILNFISKLEVELQRNGEDVHNIFDEQLKNFELVQSFETIEDIKDWLVNKLSNLSEQLAEKNQKKDRKIINDIKKYVKDQVENKITLKDVADHFNFSPNYLGHLFKAATNEKFGDYLIRMNMERACEYLLDPLIKIYEICDRVGYKNVVYFNRQFKDYYGMTPSEYRKRNKV